RSAWRSNNDGLRSPSPPLQTAPTPPSLLNIPRPGWPRKTFSPPGVVKISPEINFDNEVSGVRRCQGRRSEHFLDILRLSIQNRRGRTIRAGLGGTPLQTTESKNAN